MGVKIKFYMSKSDEKDGYIHSIEAGEICSEFIARYFAKVKNVPNMLIEEVIEENYKKYNYEKAVQDMYKGMYKVNVDKMLEDDNGTFEFKTFKECKSVRRDLLDIYEKLDNPKSALYALLCV